MVLVAVNWEAIYLFRAKPVAGDRRGRLPLGTWAGVPSPAVEAGMKILVVEDDREAARYLAKGLGESGHVVDTASIRGQADQKRSRHSTSVRA